MTKQRTSDPLPYYRFYWRDFRASRAVQRMTYIQRGLYRSLLDECWAVGSLPQSFTELAEICDCPVKVVEKAWPVLARQFMLVNERYINERMDRERTAADQLRAGKSLAGKKSARKRKAKRPPTDVEQPSTRVQHVLHSSSNSISKSSSSAARSTRVEPRAPDVAPGGVSAPRVAGAELTPLSEVDWRAQFESAGVVTPIGFRPKDGDA